GEVIMDDGGEALLQVDTLGQAVGGDQHTYPIVGGEVFYPRFAFLRWQGPGDRFDPQGRVFARQQRPQLVGEVLGGRDVAAEDDGVEPVADQRVHDRREALELGVTLRPAQRRRLLGERP